MVIITLKACEGVLFSVFCSLCVFKVQISKSGGDGGEVGGQINALGPVSCVLKFGVIIIVRHTACFIHP